MTNSIKVTGSMTVSEVTKAFFPSGVSGGSIVLNVDGTTVAGSLKRATSCALSLKSLAYALVKSGVVAEANLAALVRIAAEAKEMDADTLARVEATIASVKAEVEATIPMIEAAPTLRVKGTAAVA